MKYALVTGGSRGIGRAVCLRLAAMGLPVIINYVSNDAAAQETQADILAQGGSAPKPSKPRWKSGRLPIPTTSSACW